MEHISEEAYVEMAVDCKNINEDYSFSDLIIKHTGSYISREKWLYWFDCLWFAIPEEYLYETYKDLLSDIHIVKGRSWYSRFFRPDLLEKIKRNNKHDTVNNPVLSSLADEGGYITVYLGDCKDTIGGCHTWAVNKEQAIELGRLKALISNAPEFYCVTGRVKIDRVIAPISVRGRDELAVLQRNVRRQTREFFNAEEVELTDCWSYWM